MRTGRWLQTYTGRAYYVTDPHPDDVCIEDIAHALSQICRYAGHCNKFYSVAEHSVGVSRLVPPEHALQGLMHDTPEAYVQDMPSPLKVNLHSYKVIEALNRAAICKHFDIDEHEPYEVKMADRDILLSEHKALFGPPPKPWVVEGAKPRAIVIRALVPAAAEYEFLTRFRGLMNEHKSNKS